MRMPQRPRPTAGERFPHAFARRCANSPMRRLWPLLARQSKFALRFVFVTMMMLTGINCKQDATHEEDENATVTTPVPVHATTARLTTLHPSIDLIGTLVAIPERTASVSPQTAGQIHKVMVVESNIVHAGDQLVQLDSRLVEAQLARAEASFDEKRAVVERLKRGFLPQEIEMARQDMQKSKATMEGLRSRIQALTALHDRHEVSDVQYQEMKSSLQAAEAEYAAATAKLKLVEAGTRPEEVAEAEAQLAIAEADRTAAKLTLHFCRITTPIDGTVTQLAARQGMFVQPPTTLATVVDLSKLFAQIRVPGAFLEKVHIGARVEVRVTSLSDPLFPGTVARISGGADPATGNVDAFALVTNESGLLRPDLSCRVRVWLPDVPDALVVPVAAIADREGTPVVTVARDNKAYEIEVKLGVQTQELAQVTQGLSPGDLVVTEGGYGLPEDCPVRIVPDSPPD